MVFMYIYVYVYIVPCFHLLIGSSSTDFGGGGASSPRDADTVHRFMVEQLYVASLARCASGSSHAAAPSPPSSSAVAEAFRQQLTKGGNTRFPVHPALSQQQQQQQQSLIQFPQQHLSPRHQPRVGGGGGADHLQQQQQDLQEHMFAAAKAAVMSSMFLFVFS